ncbi:Uncharacterized protein HZ326_3665 [Fusarium oxysporum f. sp. albedinis]|nr:Uncharacterized protein HZ326_3665 [Fusarium oxysporum f. sp. albedinis]
MDPRPSISFSMNFNLHYEEQAANNPGLRIRTEQGSPIATLTPFRALARRGPAQDSKDYTSKVGKGSAWLHYLESSSTDDRLILIGVLTESIGILPVTIACMNKAQLRWHSHRNTAEDDQQRHFTRTASIHTLDSTRPFSMIQEDGSGACHTYKCIYDCCQIGTSAFTTWTVSQPLGVSSQIQRIRRDILEQLKGHLARIYILASPTHQAHMGPTAIAEGTSSSTASGPVSSSGLPDRVKLLQEENKFVNDQNDHLRESNNELFISTKSSRRVWL